MLTNLRVKNYALLDKIDIEFGAGLNVLTGETGSGKSILIGALGLVLGGRGTSEVVRTGEQSAIIEGLFEGKLDEPVQLLLNEIGIDADDQILVIRRELGRDGRNRCSINGHLVTVAVLKRLGNLLVDLHGQHDHQSLLDARTHMDYLDGFNDIKEPKKKMAETYRRFIEKLEALEIIENEIAVNQDQVQLYKFQLEELNKANITTGEDENLERERLILENSEQLIHVSSVVCDALSESDNAIVDGLLKLIRLIEEKESIDPQLSEVLQGIRSARYSLDDSLEFLQRYRDRIEYDPERLEEILDRLNLISLLKRKYGSTIEELHAYRNKITKELSQMDNKDERRNRTREELESCRNELAVCGKNLSERRKNIASKLEKRVINELSELGMGKICFEVKVEWEESDDGPLCIEGRNYRVNAKGMDKIEFLISPNAGEMLKPLVNIASGGEISRIMLALKVILAASDRMPTMVFDELDSGIGGRIAESVGHRLKILSRAHQVLCITHLHQVACWGQKHFTVQKQFNHGRSATLVDNLDESGRIQEIARMLAGETVDQMALAHAREMIRRTTAV